MTPCNLVRELKTYRGNLMPPSLPLNTEHEESIVLRKVFLGYTASYSRGHIRENPKAYTVPSKRQWRESRPQSLFVSTNHFMCNSFFFTLPLLSECVHNPTEHQLKSFHPSVCIHQTITEKVKGIYGIWYHGDSL